MKTLKTFSAVFAICFLFGLGIVASYPSPATAGNGGGCDPFCGYIIVCEAHEDCTDPQFPVMHVKYKMWYPAPVFCDGPWTCGRSELGCGGLCDPE